MATGSKLISSTSVRHVCQSNFSGLFFVKSFEIAITWGRGRLKPELGNVHQITSPVPRTSLSVISKLLIQRVNLNVCPIIKFTIWTSMPKQGNHLAKALMPENALLSARVSVSVLQVLQETVIYWIIQSYRHTILVHWLSSWC